MSKKLNIVEEHKDTKGLVEWMNPSYGVAFYPTGAAVEIFMVGLPTEEDPDKVEYFLLARFWEDGKLISLKRKGQYTQLGAERIVKRFVINNSKRGVEIKGK